MLKARKRDCLFTRSFLFRFVSAMFDPAKSRTHALLERSSGRSVSSSAHGRVSHKVYLETCERSYCDRICNKFDDVEGHHRVTQTL